MHPSVKLLIVLFLLVIISCNQKDSKVDRNDIFEKASPNDSLAFYFPAVLNNPRKIAGCENFVQNWYSSSLYSFKVPILYLKSDSEQIYRLTILPSFYSPVCFTMKKYQGNNYINAKILDRQPAFYDIIQVNEGVYDTVQIADRLAFIKLDTTILLGKNQWNKITDFIAKNNFWKSPFKDPSPGGATDTAEWILEGRENGKYHFICREGLADDFLSFGRYLIEICGLKLTDSEIL
ncbi:MAG TPA: hypothetical protein VK498_02330 [Ferruginibacter sp.]|nr:hypothetical protein [Ferruginibacter sp.]